MLPMFKKTQHLKGLTINLVQGILNIVPCSDFFLLFVERNLMDRSYILWNKFQYYQLKLILTNHFW